MRLLLPLECFFAILLAFALVCSLTVTWVALLSLLVIVLLRLFLKQEPLVLKAAPFLWPVIVFVAATFISGFCAGGLSEAFKSLGTIRGLLVYPVAYQVFQNKELKDRTLLVFLAFGALSGFYGVIQQIFNFHPFTYPYLQATGFLGAPMPFAGLMQLVSFLSLGLMLKGPKPIRPYQYLIAAGGFLGLLFASERSAWLGLFAGVLAISARLSPRAFGAAVLSLFVAALLAWGFVPVVKTRLSNLGNLSNDVGVQARLEVWQVAVKTFARSPLTGVGPRHFPRVENAQAIVPGHSSDLNHAHNNFLQILATMGVLGALAFLWISFYPLGLAFVYSKSDGVALGLLGALTSLMVAGLFEYNFGSGQVRLAQWFCLALLSGGLAAKQALGGSVDALVVEQIGEGQKKESAGGDQVD